MIGFSVMMWFCAVILIFCSILLLGGNDVGMHGKVIDQTEDRKGYAKAIGKPLLLLGIGIAIIGIAVFVIQELHAIIISVCSLLLLVILVGLWFIRIQKDFR